MKQIEYYDNDPNKGIKYDWKHLQKEYRKLKCPKGVYNPFSVDFSRAAYCMCLSDRSSGKTTNVLLLGLLMYRDYGTVCHVIRQNKEICEPKNIKNMYAAITEHGYIEKIFDGEYNDIRYKGKRWTLVFVDELGYIIRESDPVCLCFGLDESDNLKSAYNSPRGDLIVFDEFISTVFGYNDFFRFMDILKTILRDRRGYIYMLSNTINKNSPWFDEFCIRDVIEPMQAGDSLYYKTVLGTCLYIQLLSPVTTEQRKFINNWIFGFTNPKLAAITGAETWATNDYQHIPPHKDIEPEMIYSKLFLIQSGKIVKLDLVHSVDLGYCVYVHRANKLYPDGVVLTNGDIIDRRYQFGFGNKNSKLLTFIWRLYAGNRFYYATNSDGALISAYIKLTKSKMLEMGK